MVFDGELPTDTAAIHPIPIPESFARGRVDRRIAVSLAYDPPVRRQRRDYLAGEMNFDLLRNVTDDEVRERYSRQGATRLPLYTGRREKLELRPGTQAINNSTLVCRSIQPQTLDPDDGDAYHLAVSHRSAQWPTRGTSATRSPSSSSSTSASMLTSARPCRPRRAWACAADAHGGTARAFLVVARGEHQQHRRATKAHQLWPVVPGLSARRPPTHPISRS